MIKGFFVDNALKMILGGEVTQDSAVWRDDVASLLPAAVNFGLQAAMWEQLKMEKDYDIPGAFIGTIEGITVDVTDPEEPFFLIPGPNLVTLSSDRALRMVYTPKGGNVYQRMSDNLYANWESYYKKIMVDQRFYYLKGMKCRLFNKPAIEDKVNISKIVSTESYADTDEMPIPAGQEMVVIEKLVQLFRQQRLTPQDPYQDGSDINE